MNNSDIVIINMSFIIGCVYPTLLYYACTLMGGI